MYKRKRQCAVSGCYRREKTSFRFPHLHSSYCEKWRIACGREEKFDINTARICSAHFSEKQKKRDLRSELMGIPRHCNYRYLRDDAVPDLALPQLPQSQRANEGCFSRILGAESETLLLL